MAVAPAMLCSPAVWFFRAPAAQFLIGSVLPVPQWWGWLQKVKSNVGKEQTSDETRPLMLSDIKFHAEY